ncbi:helix-hairpin-helix domain-containing protein [Mycolicibacterium sp. S2-37]|uniref:helix-hairpin-helix domain-containing protein n=1 Tax=Mycolicibacterium sp. S2-37 TaxID=2810297 RepID=UPI001A945961|nr:helix-hairpin-helix domain-containing protein [Mycolicibacterium sp. S2-37]MBO0678202.1 helix-hairpin-helix domain-containing protein [Mycolicibacterium sp. S2-37]
MRTEEPAERLHRRLGAEEESGHDTDRVDTALSRWLPEGADASRSSRRPDWLTAVRADPGRAGAVALAALGAVAVLVTVFTVWRDSPPPVASANLPDVQMISSASASASAGPPPADAQVVVSVVGLVHKPGLVTLSPGARIADAIEAAGGTAEGADLIGLNMARKLADGEQIIVGIAPAPGQPPTMGSSTSGPAGAATPGPAPAPTPGQAAGGTGEPVNLNTATVEELDTLPGVGPVTAAAIVAWRDANGAFSSVDQLGDVDGIGPARLAKLRDLVHV